MARLRWSVGATVMTAWFTTSRTAMAGARSPWRETARTISRSDMRPVTASPLFTTNAAMPRSRIRSLALLDGLGGVDGDDLTGAIAIQNVLNTHVVPPFGRRQGNDNPMLA